MSCFLQRVLNILTTPVATIFFIASASGILANDGLDKNLPVIGKPIPSGINFQPPVTELARDIQWARQCSFGNYYADINICKCPSCLGFYPI